MTEQAIRSLGVQDDAWGDTYPDAEDPALGAGHIEKRDRIGDEYKKDTGRRYNDHLEYRSSSGETMPNERSISRGEYAQNSFGTSSHVQDQFPGQDPSTFAGPAFDPITTQGVMTGGAAAEYYSQASMQPHETASQHVPSQAFTASQSTRPTGQFESLMSKIPAYPENSYSTAPSNSADYGDASNQNYTYSQPHRPTVQVDSASHEYHHQHFQSVPSTTTYIDPSYTIPLSGQSQRHGKHASTGQNLSYVAAAGATVAGAHSHHHHTTHQHTHSAPIGNDSSHSQTYGYPPQRPYTSGAMAMQHKHKGPISKFVDWWKDYEDVRKMEEYTEYIGVCKYCFDPRSTATDAPRKHYRGGRRSSDSLRRRSSDSLRRSHTNASTHGRVDKDARYHSSDSERRSRRTSWLGAGVAAYGLSKVGKSLWQSSRDFDDTYSVNSGRKSEVSRSGSRRGSSKNYSTSHDSRSERTGDRKGEYDDFEERRKAGVYNLYRPELYKSEHSSSDARRIEDGRHGSAKSVSSTAGGSRHPEDQIHVRHPSPDARHVSRHVASGSGHKDSSRNQSPSLAQILGLTSSQKRMAATAVRSSSTQQEGMFTGFFSTQPSRNRHKQSKKKGFFNFANSSSSSANSDLAFDARPTKNVKATRKPTRENSDDHLKATLLGIGATAAALSAVQGNRSGNRKVETLRSRNRDHRHATHRSKQSTSEEDGWESATDDESVSSGLAFGDFDTSRKGPRRRCSSESITSQSSGTDKWGWRWRRKSDKKAVTNDVPQVHRDDNYSGRESSLAASRPLRYVDPAPIPSPMHSEVRGSPSTPGVFPEQPYNVNGTPIQQPQPITPLQSSIFGTQTPPDISHNGQHSPRVSARPAIPTELRRTQSSPVSNHTMRNAAIAGIAGAAAAGILANGKSRARDDSPSNVRFELTKKQAKKEERQHRKENAKESKDQAKEEARAKKERARLDRERAVQEDSIRKAADDARRYEEEEAERQQYIAEQAEQHQARLREAAAAEALEREEDRRREQEIKEFMQSALAEQAREAEQKKREAWQAQQMAGARQESPPDTQAGPSTTSRSAVTPSGYCHDYPKYARDGSTSVPYATRSYEPTNEHSGQPLMDDDLIDPDFFTRRRSHSDLARHEELAKKAAAKIIADLEDKYSSPVPSQAEFFAPKELFETSKGKTKIHGPIDDNDFEVYHMSENQLASMPNEPPPPYQPSYQFVNVRDKKGPAPWDIPKLNVIAPTPPASYAGSAKDDKSPIIASRNIVREASQEPGADIEPQKSSKISWGEDQTRFYEITTPESSQEHVVLSDEPPHGVSGLRMECTTPESSQGEHDYNRHMAKDSNLDRNELNDLIREVTRETQSGTSNRFYRQPFVESIDDIAFTLDSPGTEGAPPVQGFVEGEVDDASVSNEYMPHVPGGFDEVSPGPRPKDTFNDDIQSPLREVVQEQKTTHEQEADDYFMTQKQVRRRDNEAKREPVADDQRSTINDQSEPSRVHRPYSSSQDRDDIPGSYASTPRSELSQDGKHDERSSSYVEAGAVVGAAAAVGILMHNARSRSPTRSKSEPEDFDRQRAHSSHSEPRDLVSKSTPTSPVYERRPSLPSHAFDDLDMLPGSKTPKKSKRNSLLNYPAIGSPLRSAMTWDEYIEPMNVRQRSQSTHSQSHGADYDIEHDLDEAGVSPESERGAASIVSAPAGDGESGRRRKHRKSHRERETSTSPRRSASVAASEPYESSHKHRRRSHRDDAGLDDESSIRSRSSHDSRRDDEESKAKKKGGILSLFRRKTSDDVVSNGQKRSDGNEERSKHHRRRQSSEHTVDDFAERRDSDSRSRSHAERDDASSRHSGSSRHRRRHHRDGSVGDVDVASQISESRRRHEHRSRDNSQSPEKDFDDTRSQTSESRRKHRHRERDLDLDDRRSLSQDGKATKDEDKSFLVDRVEDEESVPLPGDDFSSPQQAPESAEQQPESISLPEHENIESADKLIDSTLPPAVPDESIEFFKDTVPEDSNVPTQHVEEAQSSPSPSEALSPPLEHMTPTRPIVPLRISSSTAVPLRFRRPPTSPSLPKERSASFSSSVAQSPSSPITPKAKRPLSSEFMHSTEFRPLYLLERTRKPPNEEAEQELPSLPPSRSASSSSLQSSEDWQSAAEDFDPSEHDHSSPPDDDQSHTEESEDVSGSAQTTPKASEFPKHILEHRPHLEPEYYSWSDMEREENLRQEKEREHHNDPAEEPDITDDEHRAGPHIDIEVNVNQNPMATDVWGDLSDEELPRTRAPIHEEPAESIMQPEEPEAEPSFTALAKKRKNKKSAKLGTSSNSTITSPIRETPAELARRREKDAQDAVDTWFQPTTGPREEALAEKPDASFGPSPEPTVAEASMGGASLPAPVQDDEAPREEAEPTSSLLSRKKSKKGKKKQQSVVQDETTSEFMSIGDSSGFQMDAEITPQIESPTNLLSGTEDRQVQTTTPLEIADHDDRTDVDNPGTDVSINFADESRTPVVPEQPQHDERPEESNHTLSKAERKKKNKKAKKAALSVAVPAVAAVVLVTTDRDTSDQDKEGSPAEHKFVSVDVPEDERLTSGSVDDGMTSVTSANENPAGELSLPQGTPEYADPSSRAGRALEPDATEQQQMVDETHEPPELANKLPPEHITLPSETQGDLDESEVIKSISQSTTEINAREGFQLASNSTLDEKYTSSVRTVAEATSKRSSWFSWMPGSKTQDVEVPKVESREIDDQSEKSHALTQEPFERLLEQPIQNAEFVDDLITSREGLKDVSARAETIAGDLNDDETRYAENIKNTNYDKSSVDNTALFHAQSLLEEYLPPKFEALTDDKNDTTAMEDFQPALGSDLPTNETTLDRFEPASVEERVKINLPGDNVAEFSQKSLETLEAAIDDLRDESITVLSVEDSEHAEDFWTVPTKKIKKGKKGKKAVKEEVSFESSLPLLPVAADEPLDAEALMIKDEVFTEVDNASQTREPEIQVEHAVVAEQAPAPLTSETAPDVTGRPSISSLEEREDLSENVPGLRRSTLESTEGAVTPIEPDVQDNAQILDEQMTLHEPLPSAEPMSATAEDEWAVPSSRKQKKKKLCKKGKQPFTDPVEATQDASVADSLDPQAREAIKTPEEVPITPDVFETPSGDTSAQYFATPADEFVDQFFVTPMQEISEQPFETSTEDAAQVTSIQENKTDSVPQAQLERLSLTSTQEGVQDESAIAIGESTTEKHVEGSNQITSTDDRPGSIVFGTEHAQSLDASELFEAETTDHDAFALVPSKVTKEDKKKAKKARPQELERELVQAEFAGHNLTEAFEKSTEAPIEAKPEAYVTADNSTVLTPPQIDSIIEAQPIARKLSKKEKRKAKKTATSGIASPLEDTSEPTPIVQDAASYFPATAEHDPNIEPTQVELPAEANDELKSTSPGETKQSPQVAEGPQNDHVRFNEPRELRTGSKGQFDVQRHEVETIEVEEVARDNNDDLPSATTESSITQEPTYETGSARNNTDVANVPVTEDTLSQSPGSSDEARTGDGIAKTQTQHLEPAAVEDQAPSVLDQLTLSEDPATDPISDPVEDHGTSADSHETQHENKYPTEDGVSGLIELRGEPQLLERSASTSGVQEEPIGTIEKLVAKEEFALEPEAIRKSMAEESSAAEAESVPVKLSKKDKRKAKKSKQTTDFSFEEPQPEGPFNLEIDAPEQITEEDQSVKILDESFSQQPGEDSEPFTAKLSKKAKKKAKKLKAREVEEFDVEDEAELASVQQLNTDLAASAGYHLPEVLIKETPELLSIEPAAQAGIGIEREHTAESTARLEETITQDTEFDTTLETEDTAGSQPFNEFNAKFIADIEQSVNDALPRHQLPFETAVENTENISSAPPKLEGTSAQDLPRESDIHDEIKISGPPGPPRDVHDEVKLMTVPDQGGSRSHGVVKYPVIQDVETPGSETAEDFWTPASTSKKNKKGVKAKHEQETVELDTVGEKSMPDLPKDREEPSTVFVEPLQAPNDKPVLAGVEDIAQGMIEEQPGTSAADEWALPTKQSKKEKRKAKKLQKSEEPQTDEIVEENPVAQAKMPDEIMESVNQPTSREVEPEPTLEQSESAAEPTVFEDRSFSRKSSKKEKRKAKKTMFSDEQQTKSGTPELEEVPPEVQPSSSVDKIIAPLHFESAAQGSPSKEDLPALNHTDADLPLIEPSDQKAEVSNAKDAESVLEPNNSSHDIDFAATLAAGLQDSGFDPVLVIDDPVFHRRASPTSVGEADPGEVTSTTTRRPRKNSSKSRVASPTQDAPKDSPAAEPAVENPSNDDFSDALTAGLLASGFAPDALAHLSTDNGPARDEPDEFSFSIPKRKKKGKKATRAETMTTDPPILAEEPKSYMPESEETQLAHQAIDSRHTGEVEVDQGRFGSAGKSDNEPTNTSPTRLAKHNFFHTSEVSQSLPVRIDHLVQSAEERVDQTPQHSVDMSMIEALAKHIPRPSTTETYTTSTMEESQHQSATAQAQNEPATWSFDSLESPALERSSEPSQEVQNSDPFVPSKSFSERHERALEAESISPVDSTTKDRTSYLFQSPVDLSAFERSKDFPQKDTRKHARSAEPQRTSSPDIGTKPQTPPAPLPPSPSKVSNIPLPPEPSRTATPPAPLPPSPSRQFTSPPIPLPPNPQPVQSPPLTRKKSLYDIGSPGPGHSSKAARRSATPQQSFREQINASQSEGTQAVERYEMADQVPSLRAVASNLSILSNKDQLRSASAGSNQSVTPSLRRISRSLSGDLRAASSRTHGPPTTIPIEPPPTPPLQDEDFNGHGASRSSDMANIYVSNPSSDVEM